MYELEHLFEQLKIDIANESYAESMNIVSESAYDTIGFENVVKETMNSIIEESSKSNLSIIEKLKARFNSTEKVVSKYKDKASKCNPIGLTYKDFIVCKSEADIKKKHDQAIKYLMQLKVEKASAEQCKKFIEDSKKNVQYMEISKIYGDGKDRYSISDIVISKKSDKELKKSDILDAIKYIEGKQKAINHIEAEMNKNQADYMDYQNKNGGISSSIAMSNSKTDDINKLRKNASMHQKSLVYITDNTYYMMLKAKYTHEIDQAKKIIIKAANYNPRNLKESYIVQDYIDSLCEFYESTQQK